MQRLFSNRWVPVTAICLLCLIATGVNAQDKVELVPGKLVVVPMPELGPTWDDKQGRVGIQLPRNYSPDKQYPAIVYFGGGGGGHDPGFYKSFMQDDWVFICPPYPVEERWGAGMDWYEPMLLKAHDLVPNINKDLIIASGFSSGGGAASTVIQSEVGLKYFRAAIPAGLTGFSRPFANVRKKRGFPLLIVIGEKDTQHDRLSQCKEFFEHAKAQGLDAEIYIEKGVGHSIQDAGKQKITQWIQTKLLQPELDKYLSVIRESFDAARIQEAEQQIKVMQQQVFVNTPEVNEQLEQMRVAAYEHGEEELERLKERPSQPRLAAFLEQWKGTPCYDQALVVYNELAQKEVDELLALDPEQRERRIKAVVLNYLDCEAVEPLMPAYNALAADDYARTMTNFRDTQHRRLLVFANQWPGSEAAADAIAKRLSIALEQLQTIMAIDHERQRQSRLTRFERDFEDLLENESIRELLP